MSSLISQLAGKLAPRSLLIYGPRLVTAQHTGVPTASEFMEKLICHHEASDLLWRAARPMKSLGRFCAIVPPSYPSKGLSSCQWHVTLNWTPRIGRARPIWTPSNSGIMPFRKPVEPAPAGARISI
jgi:hypothetical protein